MSNDSGACVAFSTRMAEFTSSGPILQVAGGSAVQGA